MPVSVGMLIWYLGTALELVFVVCSVARGSYFKYFFLNLYFILSVLTSVGRFVVFTAYGPGSDQYMYVYYYTDPLLTLALFAVLISLFLRVFEELGFAKHIRLGAGLLLLGTVLFSYAVVAQSSERLSTKFAYELSQNLYFVGLVLTYILWVAVLKLRETRTRVVQFILSLGLYFSAYAASYALMNFADKGSLIQYLSQALGCFLPLSWCITLLRYTEESRIVPARLVAVPR